MLMQACCHSISFKSLKRTTVTTLELELFIIKSFFVPAGPLKKKHKLLIQDDDLLFGASITNSSGSCQRLVLTSSSYLVGQRSLEAST